MRKVVAIVSGDGSVETNEHKLGFNGEHNACTITFNFDKLGYELFSTLDYFRAVIDGNYSEDLYFNNGGIDYTVPEQCMRPPEVMCQLIGYKVTDGEPTVIIKSACFKLLVDYSEVLNVEIENEPDILEKTVAKCTELAKSAQQSVDEVQQVIDMVAEVAENVGVSAESAAQSALSAANSVTEAEQSALAAAESASVLESAVLDYNNISNAFIGTVSGVGVVGLKDVSPLPHNVSVKIESKNLYNLENTISGYIGSSNTVCTGQDDLYAMVYAECEPGEIYTVSKMASQRFSVHFADAIPQNDVKVFGGCEDYTATAITVTAPENAKYIVACVYNVFYDTTITREDMIRSVQIEKGSIATEYTPFTNPTDGYFIFVNGKNLLPITTAESKTQNGVEWTNYLDGSIGVVGTPTDFTSFPIVERLEVISKDLFLSPVLSQDVNLTYDVSCINAEGNAIPTTSAATKGGHLTILDGTKYITIKLKRVDHSRPIYERIYYQLEVGSKQTEYESYVEPETYCLGSSDKLTIQSMSPSMTLYCNSRIVVNAVYNKDLNKAFQELQNEIANLRAAN